jgi:1-acyl-sn-glycerol-3-phosphate acyltransferase
MHFFFFFLIIFFLFLFPSSSFSSSYLFFFFFFLSLFFFFFFRTSVHADVALLPSARAVEASRRSAAPPSVELQLWRSAASPPALPICGCREGRRRQ